MPLKPQEYLYLHYFSEWEKTAPKDGHLGLLKGRGPVKNTQTARLCRLLTMIVSPITIDADFQKLARRTQRKDGRSNVSKDRSWMREPYEITKGWYFEGCMNLLEKQAIIKALPELGLISREFVPCAQDFVAGNSVEKYWPDKDEASRLLQQYRDADPIWFEQASRLLQQFPDADPTLFEEARLLQQQRKDARQPT